MKKRLLISVLVLGTVFATVFGLAATLGVGTNSLGAGSQVVGSCDTDGVTTAYVNTWDATDGRYEVTGVDISGIAVACDTKTLKAALTDSATPPNVLGQGSVTVSGTSASVSPSPNPAASAVTNVHVVIG